MMAKYTLGNRKMECGTSPVFINPVRCECVEGLLAQIGGGGGGGRLGVVSNYLDEKLHQPPITDIQLPAPLNPLHIWLTRYSEGYDTGRRATQTLL